MAKFCFTGNPFVDAGIAGMCAAANVSSLDALDMQAVDKAVETLLRVMTSDAVFKKRPIEKKETAFATSEMSVIFPNGPLSQASVPSECKTEAQKIAHKKKQYAERVGKKLAAFRELAAGQMANKGLGTCFVDGTIAFMRVGNDEFPLVDSKTKRNFHPGLQGGHAIGALTALALEFFPLSVLRTGVNTGLFWFVHTASSKIAIACAELTLNAMNHAISRSDGLGFFGDWNIPSRDAGAALVALIRDLMSGKNQSAISWNEIETERLPATAYVFSNDNRGPQIAAHDLPHQLFWFFAVLNQRPISFERFNQEILRSEKIGWQVAKRMLAREPIAANCSIRPEGGKTGRLRGGWQAHSLYATEVLGMNSVFVRDVEAVSERIIHSEDAKDLILALQKMGASQALLRLSRKEMLNLEEYARLVPPDMPRAAFAARDYLLAAIYERQAAAEQERPFLLWDGEPAALPDKHPFVSLVEQIGAKLTANPDIGKRVATDLAKARRLADLRGAILRAMRRGILSWSDFVQLFPPDEARISFLLRDYLLAYLYTALRTADLPEPETIPDKVIEQAEE